MAKKKVRKIDPKKQFEKLDSASQVVLRIGTAFGFIAVFSLVIISILTLTGVSPMPTDKVRRYKAEFMSYDGTNLFSKYYNRGEKLDYGITKEDMARPTSEKGTRYTFLGWDINEDKIPDIIPSKMYYSFVANPVYFEFNPYGYTEDEPEDEDNPSIEEALQYEAE